MSASGLFIMLFDQDSVNLYVENGVYGELRPPVRHNVDSRSKHYAALADYACARNGTHIFFFNARYIFYGGQVSGSSNSGVYCINGPYSPMGRQSASSICWDESTRQDYQSTNEPGVFKLRKRNMVERCQPYLLRFEDRLDLKGYAIESDDLYTELNFLHHPVPSNSIQDMSICTLTPGETTLLLRLLSQKGTNRLGRPRDRIPLCGTPTIFEPSYGIRTLAEATSKYHHDSMILSNPLLLPADLRPTENTTICRKVPLSPFKPVKFDRADICYYSSDSPDGGTLPNKIIELEWKPAGNTKIKKLVKYIKYLNRLIPDEVSNISFNLFAPSFKVSATRSIPREYSDQIHLVQWIQ